MTEYPGYEIDIFESDVAFYCCGTNCVACSPLEEESDIEEEELIDD